MKMNAVTVFCGSKPGADPEYMKAAQDLGAQLAKNSISLIYGGGNKGMMGAVANACLDAGGRVVAQKGTPILSSIKTCNVFTTKYNLAVAPNVLDNTKKEAPVLYALKPKRVSK